MRSITLALSTMAAIAALVLTAPTARAESGFFDANCAGCHGSNRTCAGCHAHGVHSSSSKSDLNLVGTTDKISYTVGETVTVTVDSGYRSGWVRVILYDDMMIELVRSTGPTGMGGGPGFPVTLTAPAPLTPGTYTWNVSWYGNQFDENGAFFGARWRPDPTNPNHGEEIVETNSFDVIAQPEPAITVDPQSLDFGSLDIGQFDSQQVTVGNQGNANLEVTSISRCFGTSTEFDWSPSGPFTITPGSNQALYVSYEPVDAGADTGCLMISSNDPANQTVFVNVDGIGVEVPTGDPDINLVPAALDFGSVEVGDPPSILDVSIQNLGDADLVVASVGLCAGTSNEFGWNLALPVTIVPGQSAVMSVSYEPIAEGPDAGCLEISSNDPVTPVVNLQVSGTGVIPPPLTPDIDLDPPVVDFGWVPAGGASKSAPVAVRNLGDGELVITSIARCQGTSAEFTWTPAAPITVPPGELRNLSVSYTPADETADSGCLTIASNDPVDPAVQLGLSGTAESALFSDGFESGDTSAWQ